MLAKSSEDASGSPFCLNVRTALAFLSGAGMVPFVMFVDHEHDEGAKWLGIRCRWQGSIWTIPQGSGPQRHVMGSFSA